MKKAILLSHFFININEEYKKEIVELCISHYRKNNPYDFIVLTGHGVLPDSKTLDMCDDYFWHPNILYSEINMGHPKLVNIGIEILENKGFKKFFKSRIDSIIMRKNVFDYCDKIIEKEKTKLLITTSNNYKYFMGDLLLFGYLDFIKECWNIDTWYSTNSGLESLGRNFLLALNIYPPKLWNKDSKLIDENTWLDILKKYTSYRDTENIKWIDLRSNWKEIISLKNYKEKLLNNEFPFKKFIYNSWLIEKKYFPINEKIFYEK